MKATDSIEEKIKKLLALPQRSNPNEAKAALRQSAGPNAYVQSFDGA